MRTQKRFSLFDNNGRGGGGVVLEKTALGLKIHLVGLEQVRLLVRVDTEILKEEE